MSAQRRIDAFLLLADEELHAAILLQQGAPRQAAYYLQQAAEKAVRALLSSAQIPFGTGHNLGYMATLLPESHLLRERVRGLDRHSGAATLYRFRPPAAVCRRRQILTFWRRIWRIFSCS